MAGVIMDLFKSHTHSFMVRIWLEETVGEAGQAVWRGHITHVPGGERRYLKDLDGIPVFITPYLREMGAESGTRSWIRKWFNGWKW